MHSRLIFGCSLLCLATLWWADSGCRRPAATERAATPANAKTKTKAKSPKRDTAVPDEKGKRNRRKNKPPAEPAGGHDRPVPPPLTVGDAAPSLTGAKWLKGTPVTAFEDGHVYVVEFWATWCSPCRASMPHGNQLQRDYEGRVTWIGVSDESEQRVQEFLQEVQNKDTGATWEQVIQFAVTVDDDDQTVTRNYREAARQRDIPCAFIVGQDGCVEWIGHPQEIGEPLAQVIGGHWDRTAALARFETQRALNEFKQSVRTAVREARVKDDWSQLKQMLVDAEQRGFPSVVLRRMDFDIAVLAEDFSRANQLAHDLSIEWWDDPHQLNSLAWELLTRIPRAEQHHQLALRLAKRANELTEEQNGLILDTVARAYYEWGKTEQAREWQIKAIQHASPDAKQEQQMQYTLEKYESELASRR